MYSMNACIGSDFAGDTARSQALFSLSLLYESEVVAETGDFDCVFDDDGADFENPGGGGRFFHLQSGN